MRDIDAPPGVAAQQPGCVFNNLLLSSSRGAAEPRRGLFIISSLRSLRLCESQKHCENEAGDIENGAIGIEDDVNNTENEANNIEFDVNCIEIEADSIENDADNIENDADKCKPA